MISLHILNNMALMSALLLNGDFDSFMLSSCSITTFTTFTIYGSWHPDFFKNTEPAHSSDSEYVPWDEVKGLCLSIIRGKNTPLKFKFIFALPRCEISGFISDRNLPVDPDDVYGLFFNLTFDGSDTFLSTGTSLRTFSLDKSLEKDWDEFVADYFRKSSIETEQPLIC